ncbi:MAG: GtrA family protein [Alphaproteobacteria bacterium]
MGGQAHNDRAVVGQFIRFAIVGTVGFVVDATVLYALLYGLAADPYSARAGSFLCAATVTWWLNRTYTFPDAQSQAAHRQWASFIGFMLMGAAVNYGTYVAVVFYGPAHAVTPLAGVAAGSMAGLAVNFTTSRLFVFR